MTGPISVASIGSQLEIYNSQLALPLSLSLVSPDPILPGRRVRTGERHENDTRRAVGLSEAPLGEQVASKLTLSAVAREFCELRCAVASNWRLRLRNVLPPPPGPVRGGLPRDQTKHLLSEIISAACTG